VKYFKNGDKFECNYVDGKASGMGIKYFKSGKKF